MRVLLLPGDGIGPEVTVAAVAVLQDVAERARLALELAEAPIGGASLDARGEPLADDVLSAANAADAVLLGAVGGPRWDDAPAERRPERGLLRLRHGMGVFANLRPARCFPGLQDASPLRPERTAGVDLVVVRELIGGIYFGEPRGIVDGRGFDTMVYTEEEVRRIAHVAFDLARARKRRLVSVDKANVLASSRLWRRVMGEVAADHPDVALSHLYVDTAAMTLVTAPASLDVLVTGNLFGDILSDEAAALTGSLGMLPSAALGSGHALYEPVHGAAPDIAGRGVANPQAAILSVAMLLRHTAGRDDLARAVEAAVDAVVARGPRTPDLGGTATTADVTAAVRRQLAEAP